MFSFTKILPQSYSMKQANCILREHLTPKLLLTLKSWLDIIEVVSDDRTGYDEMEEVMVWYSGWKHFLLEASGIIDERGKVEETFYLMMLMIDEKLSATSRQ